MVIHLARGARHRSPRALHGALASRRPAQIYAPRVRRRAQAITSATTAWEPNRRRWMAITPLCAGPSRPRDAVGLRIGRARRPAGCGAADGRRTGRGHDHDRADEASWASSSQGCSRQRAGWAPVLPSAAEKEEHVAARRDARIQGARPRACATTMCHCTLPPPLPPPPP